MKKLFSFLSFSIFFVTTNAQVGIGTTTPDSKAILDLTSTGKGLLLPRLTVAQRNAITSPPLGLVVFNSDEGCLDVYSKTFSAPAVNLNFLSGSSITGGHSAWQEFTPTVTGNLAQIDLTQYNPTTGSATPFPVTMTIYSSATGSYSVVTGTPVGSTVATIPAGSSANIVSYYFSNVVLTAGIKYIFQVQHVTPANAIYGDMVMNSSDVYAGHNTWVGGHNRDLSFRTYYKVQGPSQWVSVKAN